VEVYLQSPHLFTLQQLSLRTTLAFTFTEGIRHSVRFCSLRFPSINLLKPRGNFAYDQV
jgi:hypothetical protein